MRFIIFIFSVFIILSYQNCGNITLQTPQKNSVAAITAQHTYRAHFCLASINGSQYEMMEPVVLNLNAIDDPQNVGSFLSDTDMDGIPDNLDTTPYSSNNSHTLGYLDYLCFISNQCPTTPSCNDNKIYFQPGITQCDLQTYTSVTSPYNIFDSNFNGIPDYIEIIRGLSPFAINDPMKNNVQIFGQTTQIANDTTCAAPNILYEISYPAQSLPFVSVENYADPYSYTVPGTTQVLNLSHKQNENIIYTAVILRSLTSPLKYSGYLHLDRIQDPFYTNGATETDVNIGNVDVNNSGFIHIGNWSQ